MRRSRYVTLRTSCSSASPFLRAGADHLSGTRRHSQCLAYTPADQVKVVILGQDPLSRTQPGHGAGRSRSPRQTKLPPSLRNIYKELKADLGCPIPATGDLTPWARQGVLLLNTTLTVREHAANSHAKLGWSTLTDYVIERCCQLPQPVVFGMGSLCPTDGRRQARRDWRGQGSRQVLPGLYASLAAFGQPCHGRTPRLYGVAPLLGSQSATRTARLDPRRLDLPRLKIDTSKNAPDGFPSGAFPIRGQINLCGRPRRHRSTDSVRS